MTTKLEQSFENPDFDFPKTVIKNATPYINLTKPGNSPEKALTALLQISAANSLISNDSSDECVHLADSIADELSGALRAFALMAEADIVASVYSQNSYIYNERNLQQESVPEKMTLWDKNMFQTHLSDILEAAFEAASAQMQEPLGPFSDFIKPGSAPAYDKKDLSGNATADLDTYLVADFLCSNALNIIGIFDRFDRNSGNDIIPFKVVSGAAGTSSVSRETKLERLKNFIISQWDYSVHQDMTPVRLETMLSQISESMSAARRAELFEKAWKEAGTPELKTAVLPLFALPDFIHELKSSKNEYGEKNKNLDGFYSERNIYNLICETLAQKPGNAVLSQLKKQWENKDIYLQAQSKILPDQPFEATLRLKNIHSGYLLVCRLPESYDPKEESCKLSKVISMSKVESAIPFSSDRDFAIPFADTLNVRIHGLKAGRYCLLVSKTKSLDSIVYPDSGKERNYEYVPITDVSALSMFSLHNRGSRPELFVVSSENSKPEYGINVTLTADDKRHPFKASLKTDNTGSVTIPPVPSDLYSVAALASSNGSSVCERVYGISERSRNNESASSTDAKIFLDRAIARPGDEVRFSAVVYRQSDNQLSAADNLNVCFRLINASGVETDTLSIVTDNFGRCEGKLRVPGDGMLGSWTIRADVPGRSRWNAPSASLRVEEYKQPTILVSLDKPALENDSLIKISGKVLSYSGMPVSGADVTVRIESNFSFRYFFDPEPAEFSVLTKSDNDGNFAIVLSREGLKDTRFEEGLFSVMALAVSNSGETAEDSTYLTLGNYLTVNPDIPAEMEIADKEIRLNVPVYDPLGNPVQERLEYNIFREDATTPVLSGTFDAPALLLSAKSLPSGTYRIHFGLPEDSKSHIVEDKESTCVFWRKSDTMPASDRPVWCPEKSLIAQTRDTKVSVPFGSRLKGRYILCVIANDSTELSRRWICSDGMMSRVEVPVPSENERIFVTFATVKEFAGFSETVTILPPAEREKLEIKVITFRDQLTPLAKETWSFRFEHSGKPLLQSLPALALMSDNALESLAPLNWAFSPRNALSWSSAAYFDLPEKDDNHFRFYYPQSYFHPVFPLLPVWKYDPSPVTVRTRGSGLRLLNTNTVEMAYGTAMPAGAVYEEDSTAEMFDSYSGAEGNLNAKMASVKSEAQETADESTIQEQDVYRESECPVAFFYPGLMTDSDGTVSIDFEVPDYNTTWVFRLLGYDKRFDTALLRLETRASKPVMVQASLPRFVRTGDTVILTANTYNNSSSALHLGGRIEVINPGTGKVLAERKFEGIETEPGGSRILKLEWTVPSDISSVVIRSFADGDGNSDGEQSVMPILPSSSPVIESAPFWLAQGQTDFSLEIPRLHDDASVTLQYCDNPSWYCLTSLPALIEEQGKTLTSKLYSWYGNTIAVGLINHFPELRNGLAEMLALKDNGRTEILTSPLQLNAGLKISALASTPWVNSAAEETERMSSLGNLLDSAKCARSLDGLLDDIAKLQGADGGMLWFPDSRESSAWCTGQTLLYFSMANRFGYLPDDPKVRKITSGCVKWSRDNILKQWNELRKKSDAETALNSILPLMNEFLYVTAGFAGSDLITPETPEFRKLADNCVRLIERSWSGMGIYSKASAAMLLWSRGSQSEAHRILASLEELSMYDRLKGMWFDNLTTQFSPWNKLITTAQVLEAFSLIDPKNPSVDRLRQWLILQRQTENWGDIYNTPELVQAILSSGTFGPKEAADEDPVSILIDGKPLEVSVPKYGELTMTLNPSEISGKTLTVRRKSSDRSSAEGSRGEEPAWGGIIEQYIAPIKSIRPASVDGLSIRKSFSVIRISEGEEKAEKIKSSILETGSSLKTGDRIQVLLTIENGRDMQYVTLSDERAACLEPVEALSGITFIDGTLVYRETRNSSTNFFFSYLPKGTYQISYDCIVTSDGTFTPGIATIQSLYAPVLAAHSGLED